MTSIPPPPPPSSWLTRFIYAAGKSDVPEKYFPFVGLGVLAACLSNRVSISIYQGSRLYPNLITLLVGPSGIGKGRAVNYGMGLLSEAGLEGDVGFFGGSLTSGALIDFLASPEGKGENGKSRAFFVTPELASSIKWGEHADALIKRMTDLFTGDISSFADATRAKGGKTQVKEPVVNWLGCSNRGWLLSNLKGDTVSGGFCARAFLVDENEYPKNPPPFPIYPPDVWEVREGLKEELVKRISKLSGEFSFTQEGQLFLEEWLRARPRPQFADQMPAFQRQRELVLKVGMLLSVAEGDSLQLDFPHLYEAVAITETEKEAEKDLIRFIASGGKMTDLDYISERIQRFREISRGDLHKMATVKGIEPPRLSQIIERLIAQEDIDVFPVESKKKGVANRIVYRWIRPGLTIGDLRREELG